MGKLVFLGGTVGNNPWRIRFMESLVARGVDQSILFNPVVDDWNDEARQNEEVAKATATYFVYYIADPMLGENAISAYSMVEATMALYDQPYTSVVVFDTTGMEGHTLKAMNQCARVLQNRFPDANIFTSFQKAEDWLYIRIVNQVLIDAATYVFGNTTAYEEFMDAYMQGVVEEKDTPEHKDIALYFDDDDNVIHIGRVVDIEGALLVCSKAVNLKDAFVTFLEEFPLPEITRVVWVEPLPE